ncbi:hypothetical protein N3K66_006417 [Trichothecium roseum]|uniref:Uncharacterized protein n=1 Tax=Trichothecium roseum TaxID=47278 RepID=A0ACC0UVB1_9HYPO|nr:hypothetical protein N3K66_006417 [Trichothecium roseum]
MDLWGLLANLSSAKKEEHSELRLEKKLVYFRQAKHISSLRAKKESRDFTPITPHRRCRVGLGREVPVAENFRDSDSRNRRGLMSEVKRNKISDEYALTMTLVGIAE